MTDIAIVIPCFNLGRFVRDALESALRQSRPATEVVVVDDGSTDLYTRQVLTSLEYPRTRIVRTLNYGVGAARNYGIRLTSADYLVTLDADDRLDVDYLAKTGACLDAEPEIGFVSTAIRAFGEASYTWRPPPCTPVNALIHSTAAHPASMFRRKVWEAVGGFDESVAIQSCADLDFWLSAMELGVRGEVLEEALLEYRVRSDSMYQSLVSGGRQLGVIQAVFQKHRATIAKIGPDLLIAKERFLEEHRAHQAALVKRRSDLVEELHTLEARIAQTTTELARRGSSPPEWGELGRLERFDPATTASGGVPIHLFYIQDFLRQYAADRHGDVLEIRDAESPNLYEDVRGTPDAPGVQSAPRTAGLAEIATLPNDNFDCVIAADALRGAYDVQATLRELCRILRDGGVLLCALPAARALTETHLDGSDYWRFTEAAVRRLFAAVFSPEAFSVSGYGNVMCCAASLAGLAADELEPMERDFVDPMFPLLYCVRAVKLGPV